MSDKKILEDILMQLGQINANLAVLVERTEQVNADLNDFSERFEEVVTQLEDERRLDIISDYN